MNAENMSGNRVGFSEMRWERAVGKQGGCSGVLGTNQLGWAVPPDEAELLEGPAGGIQGLGLAARAMQAIHSTTKLRLQGTGHLLPAAGARSLLGAASIPQPRWSPVAPSSSQHCCGTLGPLLPCVRSGPALQGMVLAGVTAVEVWL